MLILIPCGRGNWNPLQLDMVGKADMHLLGTRVVIELGGVRREFWVRGVVA